MEITVKSQKRRREAPTYPAAAHRAWHGGAARGNSTQPPGGICSSRAAPAWATLYNMPALCVPGVTLSPPRDHAPHCWFLEQQPHLHTQVALVEGGQAGVLRPVKCSVLLILQADVQSHTQQECWYLWEGGTSVYLVLRLVSRSRIGGNQVWAAVHWSFS